MTAPITGPATSPPNGRETESTNAIYTAIRRYLLGFSPDGDRHLSDVLGTEPDTRLFIVRGADDAKYPYGTMRLEGVNGGNNNGLRISARLEIQLYGRPFTQGDKVEDCADLIQQAMQTFLFNSDGLAFCHGYERATLPAGADPADSEVYTVRLLFTLAIWPAYLTRLTYTLPE